ncbi:MAG: type II toxin-antitoxin system VapC family toxin [Chloroflexota bacterium]
MSICVDASLIVKCLVSEPDSNTALVWLRSHRGEDMIAPTFIVAEVASALRKKVRRRELTHAESLEAMAAFGLLEIRTVPEHDIACRALELSAELNQSTAYDTIYLALAEHEQCEYWTADARFANAVSPKYPFIRLLG